MTIKSLLVKIGADTSELKAGLAAAGTSIEKHASTFRAAGVAVTAAGAAITGTVGMMIKSYVQAGDEVQKMAIRTGMSTESLSELRYAANICGASLNEVELGVKKMSKTILDAAEGQAEYIDAFARINLKAEELIALSPEEQFDKIARAIANTESPTIRAATAQEIFGRAGTKLLPLFKEGPAGLEALRKKAHELGIVFDQEAANKAAVLNDAITTLKSSLSGVGNVVAGTLAPAITGLVGKITGVIVKVKEWMTAHPGLSGAIIKVVTAMGLLMTATGPILIVLPTLVTSLKMLRLAQLSTLGPIGLATAALAGLAVGLLAVKDATDKADAADKRFVEKNIELSNKLYELVTSGKMAIDTYYKLWDQFEGNAAAMAKYIQRGNAGKLAQEGLVEIGKKHAAVIAAQKQALLDEANAELRALQASEAAKKQIEDIINTRRQLTDEIQKATLGEYDYQKWAIQAAYEERAAAIGKEITDEKAKGELLAKAKQSYNAQLAALEKQHRDEELQARIDFAKQVYDEEKQQTVDRIQAEKDYLAQRQQIVDAIRTMNMSQLEGERYMIEQEAVARAQEIRDSKTLTEQQKTDLLAIWSSYYAQLIQKNYSAAQIMAAKWAEQIEKIAQVAAYFISGLDALFSQATKNEQIRLDNEEKMKTEALDKNYAAKTATIDAENAKAVAATESEYAAKAKALEDNIADEEERQKALADLEVWKNTALEAQKAIHDKAMETMEQEKADAEARIAEDLEKKKTELRRKAAIQEKAVALMGAIVNTAAAIAKALPNIPLAVAVGIMGAAQVALIARQPIPLAEGGLVKKPTYAMLGEEGPELVLPLRDLKPALAMAGGGVTVRQSNYFYGNISNAGDLDEISRRLAERTVQAISKGRR